MATKPPPTENKVVGMDKKTANKVIGNLVMVTIIMTVISMGLVYLGMSYVVVMFVVGMLPTAVAKIVDRRPGRRASNTIMMMNMAGLLPYVFKVINTVFSGASPDEVALSLISNPYTWLVIYGFATFGWLIVQFIPQIVFQILLMRSDHLIRKLEHAKEQLIEEWGTDIKRR